MMNDVIRVEFGALQHASDSIATALRTLREQLAQLERDAAPLVATWEGDAQQAYRERQTRWQQAADQLSAMLRDIKTALDDSAADYLQTESRNTAMFRAG
jgi:early secretory antigenic target protein ESAT-6